MGAGWALVAAGVVFAQQYGTWSDSDAFYRPEDVHVMLSVDADRSPEMFKPGKNGQKLYERPNRDYLVAWIRTYGKGRIYYNSLGHMPETMMSKQIMGHVFAAIQSWVGDLEADTTSNSHK